MKNLTHYFGVGNSKLARNLGIISSNGPVVDNFDPPVIKPKIPILSSKKLAVFGLKLSQYFLWEPK